MSVRSNAQPPRRAMRPTPRSAVCFVALWISSLTASAGNAPPLILQHLTTLDGLPQGTVMATLRDSQGFVWLGTEDGLVRFDGREMHRYAYSRSSKNSLPGNFVNAMVEDAHGDLWLAIKGSGLARWHRQSDSFTAYRHDPASVNSLSSDAVRSVLLDRLGRVWIGTSDAGVNVLDPVSGTIHRLRRDAGGDGALLDDRIQTLTEDRMGNIWVGTYSGLDRWQLKDGAFVHEPLAAQTRQLLGGKQVMQIYEDAAGTFWIGTLDAGLLRLDGSGREIASFQHDAGAANSIVSNDVRAILEDRAGHLWIGTEEGLDLLDPATAQFAHYRHDKQDRDSLTDSFIMSLYQDGNGLLWIGTRAGGVSRWDPRSWELGANRPQWLEGKLVTSFADAPDHRLWVGSMGGGLVQVDTRTGEWRSIDALLKGNNVLGESRVMSLHLDRHGALWIGTMAAGLKQLLPDGRIVSIPTAVGEPRSLSAAGIMTIYEGRNGLLWIGTHGGGANVLDPATGLVRQLPHSAQAEGSTTSDNITSFLEDKDGNIWIGTDGGGLNLAGPDGKVRAVYSHDPSDPTSLSANTVYALAADSKGSIWVATDGGGLDQVTGSPASPKSLGFRNISRSTGLSSDTIYGVLSDAAGRLWLSGNSGLMRYDPVSATVKTYHREHGLQGEEFNFGAFHRMSDGRLCFGGPGGYDVFDPLALSAPRSPPRIALTGVEILGAPLRGETPYWALSHMTLDHLANIVSFDFAALDFAAPNRTQMAYRMLGLSDHWIDLGSERRITLTNLDAGDHVLEVRAASEGSNWSTAPLRLAIHKNPAPWQSPAAYAAYAVAGLVFIGLLILAQRKKLSEATAAQQRLESEVLERTQELRDANQRLIVADAAKSSFLARMGHELRTPMNGVLGMTELLERTSLSAVQARHTHTIKSSAQTLLKILNDLLDLSKAQAGKVLLEALPVDFTRLTEECSMLFSGIAESKGLELIVCPPVGDDFEVMGDPLRLRQILTNLIGNAVKFTAKGEVVIRCDILRNGRSADVRLTVADTGIGLSDESIAKIFEPFAQADESTTRRFGGSGLGLSICQELVALMGGSISVSSEPDRGSTFVVSLRLEVGQEHAVRPPAPAPQRVRLVCRRPALSSSLQRYAARCHLSVDTEEHPERPSDMDGVDAIIIDADSCADALESYLANMTSSRAVAVVIASSKAIQAHRLNSRIRTQHLIRKPLYADTLKEMIGAVLGSPADGPGEENLIDEARESPSVHVLIVEDDNVNAAVARGYLRELGCTSVWVADGEAAIARQAVERFDLILMDLNMPGLDGYATVARIRQGEGRGERVPIIALTAAGTAAYRDACLSAGMDDILSKPYTVAEFSALLRRWAGRGGESRPARIGRRNGAELSSIDEAVVNQMRKLGSGNRFDLYSQLVTLFTQNSRGALADIGSALNGGDRETARRLSHKLKAAAANVGALEFSEVVAELEQRCADGNLTAASRLYASLAASYPVLIEELCQLRLREIA